MEIKSRWSGAVIFSSDDGTIKLTVSAAIKARANLSRANLSRADLHGANLSWGEPRKSTIARANYCIARLVGSGFRRTLRRSDDVRRIVSPRPKDV